MLMLNKNSSEAIRNQNLPIWSTHTHIDIYIYSNINIRVHICIYIYVHINIIDTQLYSNHNNRGLPHIMHNIYIQVMFRGCPSIPRRCWNTHTHKQTNKQTNKQSTKQTNKQNKQTQIPLSVTSFCVWSYAIKKKDRFQGYMNTPIP